MSLCLFAKLILPDPQQPPDTGHGALDPLDEVVAGIQLEHRVDPLSQKVGMDRLCVLLNGFQDRIAGL